MLSHLKVQILVAIAYLILEPAMIWSSVAEIPLVLNAQRLHLRSGDRPEWEEFAEEKPDAQRLELHFDAHPNVREATLFIRQDGVKQDWLVELNGKRLGKLFLMEADVIHRLALPAGSLREGDNLVSIIPPKETDDILLQEIRIDPRPVLEAIGESFLEVSVLDAANSLGVPCRLTIVDPRGTLVPLVALTNAPLLAIRPGVIYTGNGRARVGLPSGDYTVIASRGFEWSASNENVHVATNQIARLTLRLRREVETAGLVSCDTHVHTFTLSGHGDATLDERMLTLAGEGIELPIATDHNVLADYSEPRRRLGLQEWFTPVIGDEVTTPEGHFNVFPVDLGSALPNWHLTNWPALMKSIRSTPGVRVVVLNHPLNIHNGFQPFASTNFNNVTGENKHGADFAFDAIEVLNSSAQQSDYMQPYRGWFALLNYGYRVTAVGSSDCHDVSRYIVGQGRTYITCPDADPGHIDVALACSNLLAGRATVSMGLLTDLTVNGKFRIGDLATGPLEGQLKVTLDVRGPSWVSATNFALFANGVKVSDKSIVDASIGAGSSSEKATVTWALPHPTHDLYLVAIAVGPGVTAPFWAIPRPYQPVSPHWESRVIGSTNPIWVDGDNDGKFTAPRDYARQLVERFGYNTTKLVAELHEFDESVASQAAGLIASRGQSVRSDVLKSAAPQVQRGFAAFAATLK